MNKINQVINYFSKLGISCNVVKPTQVGARIPLFFSDVEHGCQVEMMGARYVLIVPPINDVDVLFIETFHKSYHAPEGSEPIYCLANTDREFCDYLKRKGMLFVVPGRQAYIPPKLVLESDRAYTKGPVLPRNRLSVRAQLFLIWYLINRDLPRVLSYREIMHGLCMKQFAVTRVAQELQIKGFVEICHEKSGASVKFNLDRSQLWEQGKDLMVSPVKEVVRTKQLVGGAPFAGQRALSMLSNLIYEGPDVRACTKELLERQLSLDRTKYEGNVVEIWKYDPMIVTGGRDVVDPISLYLSMRDDKDPRTELALNNILEKAI